MEQKSNEQQQAQNLYFQTGLSTGQIARLIDVNRKTVYHWMVKNNWREIKKATLQTPTVLAQDYYVQLRALNQKIAAREDAYPTKQEADIIRKLSMTVKQIKITPALSEVIEIMALFIDHIQAWDAPLAKQIVRHADTFVSRHVQKPVIEKAYQRITDLAEIRAEENYEKQEELSAELEDLPTTSGHAADTVLGSDNEVTLGSSGGNDGVTQKSQHIENQQQKQDTSPQFQKNTPHTPKRNEAIPNDTATKRKAA